ncbi:MAG: PEGA domain-containing protein [Phycisphaerales bacterium]|nr:MAG: PEGA domain-containing protein [Phycisphaerales bacterium]
MKKLLLCTTLVTVLFSQGCCSLFCSGSQNVSIRSDPPGASVEMGPHQGTTPYEVSVPRGKDYVIRATYEGQTKTRNLTKSIEPVYWVNILFWPGLIIDLATGKMWEYDPTVYNLDFTSNQ